MTIYHKKTEEEIEGQFIKMEQKKIHFFTRCTPMRRQNKK